MFGMRVDTDQLMVRGEPMSECQAASVGGGLQGIETSRETTLASSSGVLVDRSSAGNLVENRADLAVFGFGGGCVTLLDGIQERLDL